MASPAEEIHYQDQIHITPWERKTWGMVGGDELNIIEISGIKTAITICYDVEFPEQIRALADLGVELLCIPYCTDDEHRHHRVT